jgi:GT2 family glycosyltransferase
VKVGVVVLTMGDRPAELGRALRSLRAQEGVETDLLVLVNGESDLPAEVADVRKVVAGRNLGVAGGRNRGAREAQGDLLFFLDDDAWLEEPDTLASAVARFEVEPDLGILSLRVDSPEGRTQRHHVPRLRVGDPTRSSDTTTFLGGACLIRRTVFDQLGGFPAEFIYAHEELSLAWRAIDRGWRVHYDGQLRVLHPHVEPTRHAQARRLMARNRVLLARRHLPWVVGALHVAVWLVLSMVRDPVGWRQHLRGTWDGITEPRVPRAPIGWRALWRMTRLGRPPVV